MPMSLPKIQKIYLALFGVVGIGMGTLAYRGTAKEPQRAPATRGTPSVMEKEAKQPVHEPRKNFRVEAPSKRVARLIEEAAERHRKEAALKWLGTELPLWETPCPIRVELRAEGQGTGATSFAFEKGKVQEQSMYVEGTLEQLLCGIIPHEVTHTVIAHHFGGPVPRWADEGAAVLAEDEDEQIKQQKILQQILETPERLMTLSKLLALSSYPNDMHAFYAQGWSLSKFLLGRGSHRKFLAFLKTGKAEGWDTACEVHYDFKNVKELEEAWLKAIRGQGTARMSIAEAKKADPTGPEPRLVEAYVEEKQLVILSPIASCYELATSATSKQNQGEPGTYYRLRKEWTKTRFDLAKVRAFKTNGKLLAPEQWHKMLAKQQPVVLSSDGEEVSPIYLKLIRAGAIVLVLPPEKGVIPRKPAERNESPETPLDANPFPPSTEE